MNYQGRLHQVVDFIDAHLDDELTVNTLSRVASLSKYHFHRQFSSLFGMTAFAYIKQARLRRASYQLAFSKDMRIIDIAIASNYESSEAFSRAFSKFTGSSPTQFRDNPDWSDWGEKEEKLNRLRVQRVPLEEPSRRVNIIEFSGARVAAITHIGPLYLIGSAIKSLSDWCEDHNINMNDQRLFNLVEDDSIQPTSDEYTCEVCVSTELDITNNEHGAVEKNIPAGRCAVIRHVGSDHDIGRTIKYLYSQWLDSSKEALRDAPIFFERIIVFPNVDDAAVTTDIYLPLE
ncbi:AraC family transcriptional regulator [Vibrio tapetis subsp. quintayensis]|uniref:AraC family transcriptional regulator n=1 Tax=Vibrio tapetis TaxID=52443 RepID=UPI0025B3D998|nr:AraC family transcriptional regulator [Vibrio tapetis]MDN3680291.1 AraC family transcriptional regulator [Vibrio tapetis subsp. quintayensis]